MSKNHKVPGTGLAIVFLLLALAPDVRAVDSEQPDKSTALNCTTAREYITTLEYLRTKSDIKLLDQDAQKIAGQVAEGCTGAAQRFIRVTSMLLQAGITWPDAAKQGLSFASRSETAAETFITVFRRAFLARDLDLDMQSALQMATSLSSEFAKEFGEDLKSARKDFDLLVGYCTRADRLSLPKPQCGAFAARITKLGRFWEKGVARDFISTFDYLRSDKGPALITGDALQIAEELVKNGPGSIDNFMVGYRYGVSAKGLNMDSRAAVNFARKMAQRKLPPETKTD